MHTIAPHTALIDLIYRDEPGHIAVALLDTPRGLALIDPGPASTEDRLRDAVRAYGATLSDVRFLLLTHIHLDHAGVAGRLARASPALLVYVHERGAPHLVDPSRLLRSAERIYGDRMQELWGETLPVPADQVRALAGGESLPLGARTLRVAYTPGHAVHHLAWFDETTGIAFTGDVCGEHVPGSGVAIPVTPPPDIDPRAMVASGERILTWHPARLFLTHFGLVENPTAFVEEHARRLVAWSDAARATLAEPGPDAAIANRFGDRLYQDLLPLFPEDLREHLSRDTLVGNWYGLARYHRTHGELPPVGAH